MHGISLSTLGRSRGLAHERRLSVRFIRLFIAFALMVSAFSGLLPGSFSPGTDSVHAHHAGIKLPVPFGESWSISQGYNSNPASGGSHYNCNPATLRDEPSGTRSCSQYWQYKYSFDIVPSSGATAAGRTVLSPVNGVIRWIDEAYGGMSIDLGDGFAYAYFHTSLAPGLAAGQSVSQGQYLGTVAPGGQAGNGGFPHLHVTLWQTTDGGNWSRIPAPFSGVQAIEGVSLAALGDSTVNQHRGTTLTSSNVALSDEPAPPAPPIHQSPAHGVTYDATSQSVTITWSPSGGATSYQVWINDAAASGWISGTSWTTPTLGTGQYAWQVKARSSAGEGSLSGKWVFWVDPAGDDDLPPLSTTPGSLALFNSPTSGSPGTNVVVTGAGMQANEIVNVYWDSSTGSSVGQTTANSAGNWRITFTVPDSAGGQHQVLARGSASGRGAGSSFNVTGSIQRAPISGTPGTTIAITAKGFAVGELVSLTFYHSSSSTHALGSLRANSNGTGTTNVTLPSATTGQHDYRALGQTSGQTAWGALWVQPSVELSVAQGSPGNTVTATVRGMPGSTSSRVAWNQSGSSNGTTLCSGMTSSTGSTSCVFDVPAAAAGAYPIVATVGTSTASANFGIAGSSAITLTPSTGPVGASFQISLGGFQANETVRLTIDSSSTIWQQTTVAANGTKLLKLTMPYLANGSHTITARGVSSNRSSTGSLTITPSMELNPTGAAPGQSASAWMRGFGPDRTITLRFNSTNATNGSSVCNGRTNDSGAFQCTFTVPAIAAGTYPVRAVSDGLGATANFAVTSAGTIVGGAMIGLGTYQVTATREGLVGGTTSNGHVITPNDHFVSLPACTPSNCPWLTGGSTSPTLGYITNCGNACFVRVTNPATGICRVEPIFDTGPWFTNDNWWEPTERRNLNNLASTVNILPQGYPGTDAARDGLDVGYGLSNGIGKSNVGYETGNRAAIDIADGTWVDIGFAYGAGIGTVTVSMLWQTGENINAARQACFNTSEDPPTVDPRLTIGSTSGHSGDLVTINGTGYGAGERVNIFWDRTSSGSPIGAATANASGAFSVVVTIPVAEIGSHLIVGKGVTTNEQASRSYLVLPTTGILISPTSGATASSTTVTGIGFHRGETVSIYWDSTGSTGTLLGTTTATDAGEITVNVSVPTASGGAHYIVGRGNASGLKASRTYMVTESTTGPTAPRISITPTTAFVGATIDVSGTGFGANERVQIYWDSTGSTGRLLTAVTAAGDGTFLTEIQVPATSNGSHLIVGRGVQSGLKPSRSLLIQAPPAASINPVTGAPGSLATVSGERFLGSESIEIYWGSTSGEWLAVAAASPSGAFTSQIAVPSSATAGDHVLVAKGVTSGFEVAVTFTVASTPTTSITINPTTGAPGTSVIVSGSGFGNGEAVNIRWDNTSSGPQLGSTTATSAGTFTTTITVPDASSGPHRLIAHAQASGKKPFLDFTVTEPQPVDPRIVIDPLQGRTGTVVTVTGSGYQPGETVELRWNSSSANAPLLGTSTANGTGAFTRTVTIPNVVGGTYRIVGKGLSSNRNPTRSFTVTPSAGASTTQAEPGDEVRLTVRGFQAGELIEIYFNSVGGTPLSSVTTNSIGVAAVTVNIPSAVNGQHSLIAVGGATSAPAVPITISNGTNEPAMAEFTTSTVPSGSRAEIELAHFWSAERVEIFWDDRTSPTSAFVIESSGGFIGDIAIPTLPAGQHSVTVRGVSSGKSASTTVTVSPSMELTPPIGAVGARIRVDVRGWTPGQSASIYFNRPAGGSGGTLVCSAVARDSGTATCSFDVPSGFAVGTVVVISTSGSSGTASANFEVRNQPVGSFDPSESDTESTSIVDQSEPDSEPSTPTPGTEPTDEAPAADTEEPTQEAVTETPAAEPTQEPTPEPTVAPAPRIVTSTAVSDVTVYSSRPDAAGSEEYGVIGAGGADGAQAYITFNVEGVGAGSITDARLVLTGSGSLGGFESLAIVPGLWIDEAAATWNGIQTSGLTRATDSGWTPVHLPPVGGGETVWIDITTSISGDGVVTFVIAGSPDAVAGFLSRESGNGPRLEITVQD